LTKNLIQALTLNVQIFCNIYVTSAEDQVENSHFLKLQTNWPAQKQLLQNKHKEPQNIALAEQTHMQYFMLFYYLDNLTFSSLGTVSVDKSGFILHKKTFPKITDKILLEKTNVYVLISPKLKL